MLVNRLQKLSRLRLNLLANYFGKAWSSGLNLLLVPVYLHYLGIEAYGLIGAFNAIAAFAVLLDLGLGMTVSREISLRWAIPAKKSTIPDFLRTVELIYWGTGLGLVGLIYWLSPAIATQWIKAEKIDLATAQFAVLILGLTFSIRWLATPYIGVLTAVEQQVAINILQGSLRTMQGVGSVLILALISPTILAFLLWQTVLTLLEILFLVQLAWGAIADKNSQPRFKWSILQEVWRFAAGISGTTVVTIFLQQMDKILLIQLLPLEQFGYYALASNLANQLVQIFAPILNVIFPRLTALVAQENQLDLAKTYHKSCLFVSVVLSPAAAGLVIFSPIVLQLWTRSPNIADQAAAPLSLLAFGSLMSGQTYIPYQLQLAIGKPEIFAITNTIAVILLIPAMIVFIPQFGTTGAAFSWAALNTMYYLGISRITHWYVLPKDYLRWFLNDTFIPIVLSFSPILLFWQLQALYSNMTVSSLCLIAGLGCSYLLAGCWYRYQTHKILPI